MNKKNFIEIGYMDSRLEKSMKTLTAEVLEQLTTSEKVRQTMAHIEAETDQEKKSQWKQQLPVVLFACQMTPNGERPSAQNGLAVESGFCLHDWDHMTESPRLFYIKNISGHERELGIVLAHITPRGEGLRLVTTMPDGEQVVQCQQRLATQFGMEQFADAKVKDITRLSFLPSKEYVMYLDKAGLFEHAPSPQNVTVSQQSGDTPRQNVIVPQQGSDTPQQNEIAPLQGSFAAQQSAMADQQAESQNGNVPQQNVAETFYYNGIKYSSIIEALLKRLATQGVAKVGERNNVLFMLVRELRHICEYNFQTVYMLVSPYFRGLPDAEIRKTIGSAIATNGRTITPMMRGVLNELKNESIDQQDDAEVVQQAKLPKVSAIEEMILSHYPKYLRSQVYMAMLPIWGLYGTHIRFDFLNGRENSLSFMTAVVGKSGSGKAFAAHLFDQMTQRIREQDVLERQKADEYVAQCNKAADDSEKPDDPRPRVRIYGDDITTSQFLEYLDNLQGEHGIQFTEEVARLQKAKRTIYGDNDDLYCKAFDNSVGGKESKSKMTRNIRIRIYLNTLFCGTPGAMHKFYNNPEGGLNNRIIYAFMPNERLKGFPHYGLFTDQERAQFEEVCDRLIEAGKDGKTRLPWLEKDILMLKNKWDKEDDENPDEVWYDLGKRSLEVAMRAGMLEWFLRKCPTDEKQKREIGKLVKWVAESMRQGVYAFCGKAYEEINEVDNAYQQSQSRMTKNKKLFSLLPDTFTTQDLITLRLQNGASANVAMVLCRWVADGLIRKVGDGRYQKVVQAVA